MNSKFKNVIMVGGFIIFVMIVGVFFSGNFSATAANDDAVVIDADFGKSGDAVEEKMIFVYIIGAVERPRDCYSSNWFKII